jgi:hypothetical protein
MNNLRFSLFNLLHDARKHSGQKVSRTLRGGLTVTVLSFNGRTWLALSRRDVAPSDVEIKTITDQFPATIPMTAERYWSRPTCHVIEWDNADECLPSPAPGRFKGKVNPKQLSFLDK